MRRNNRHASVDDLERGMVDLVDHVKVLVAAVDDLRCEVEWWAKNAANQRWENESAAPCRPCQPSFTADLSQIEEVIEPTGQAKSPILSQASEESAAPIPETSAAERLASVERELTTGPPGDWPADWDDEEPPELPVGRVIRVDENVWSNVLDFRPAHIVHMGCSCEDGIGAPYLLAWQSEKGHFLREMTEGEAIKLQQVCLASQVDAELAIEPGPGTTQLGLWQD